MSDRIISDKRVTVRLWEDQHEKLEKIFSSLKKKSQASKRADVFRLAVDKLIQDHYEDVKVKEE